MMVLVDTSVLIDYLKGRRNPKIAIFAEILARDIPFGISVFTYQEILQGARDEREYKQLRGYLDTQAIYCPSEDTEIYEKAARLFFDLRRKGVTVRSSIDTIIALTAMGHNLSLLHNDRDFDAIAEKTPELRILATIP